MEYNDLISGIKRFGATDKEICAHVLGISSEKIQENIVITPGWRPEKVPGLGKAELITSSGTLFASYQVWNIKSDDIEITYIITGYGAPVLMDALLSLGISNCKKIIFVSSVGALDSKIGIGDIVIPEYSICGDGASRYIASDKMETAVAFRAAKLMKKPLVALFSVSDNTAANKSLICERPQDEINYRQFVRGEILPKIVLNLIKADSSPKI